MSEEKGSFAAIRMPAEQLDFIKRNPKVGHVGGAIMVSIADYHKKIKEAKSILDCPQAFEGQLENGTKEELAKFFEVLKNHVDGASLFDASEEQVDQVIAKVKESRMDVVVTDFRQKTV